MLHLNPYTNRLEIKSQRSVRLKRRSWPVMETSDFFTRTKSSVYFLLSPYKRNSFPSINPAQVGSLIPWAEEQRRDGAVWEAKQPLVPLSQRGGGQTETKERAKWIVKDEAESQILRCRRRGAENTHVCVGCWGGGCQLKTLWWEPRSASSRFKDRFLKLYCSKTLHVRIRS